MACAWSRSPRSDEQQDPAEHSAIDEYESKESAKLTLKWEIRSFVDQIQRVVAHAKLVISGLRAPRSDFSSSSSNGRLTPFVNGTFLSVDGDNNLFGTQMNGSTLAARGTPWLPFRSSLSASAIMTSSRWTDSTSDAAQARCWPCLAPPAAERAPRSRWQRVLKVPPQARSSSTTSPSPVLRRASATSRWFLKNMRSTRA